MPESIRGLYRDAIGPSDPAPSLLVRVLTDGSDSARRSALQLLAKMIGDDAGLGRRVADALDPLVEIVVDAAIAEANLAHEPGGTLPQAAARLVNALSTESVTTMLRNPVPIHRPDLAGLGVALEALIARSVEASNRSRATYNLALRKFHAGEAAEARQLAVSAAQELEVPGAANAPGSAQMLATALNLVAMLHVDVDPKAAESAARRSVELHAANWDNSETSQANGADACTSLGVALNRLGRPESALRAHREAVRIRRSLMEWRPSVYADLWVQASMNAATTLSPDEAAPLLDQLDSWATMNPNLVGASTLALLRSNRAWSRGLLGIDALHDARAAVSTLRRLVDLVPGRYSSELAHALVQLARCLAAAGRRSDAAAVAGEAAQVLEGAVTSRRESLQLASALADAARFLREGDEWAEADRVAERAACFLGLADTTDAEIEVLARLDVVRAASGSGLGEHNRAAGFASSAVVRWRRLVQSGRQDRQYHLALALSQLALIELDRDEVGSAEAAASDAMDVARVAADGRPDLDFGFVEKVHEAVAQRRCVASPDET